MDNWKDSQQTITRIKQFLCRSLDDSGLAGYVVGLSGGIDSAVSASLAVKAVGSESVFGILMPYSRSSRSSIDDAQSLADYLKIDYTTVDISPMIDSYFALVKDDNRVRAGNKMARERMSILFDYAHRMDRLVLGTGNRTEICLGYTTLFGDSACSLNPIGQLYKTEIRQIARVMSIPDQIIEKSPSADLWENQTDEDEIGVRYEIIDKILTRIVDDSIRSREQLRSDGFSSKDIERVMTLLNRNSFKRIPAEIASLDRAAIPDSIELE